METFHTARLRTNTFYRDSLKAFKLYFDKPLLFQMQNPTLKIIYCNLIDKDASVPEAFRRQKDIDVQASLRNIHKTFNQPNTSSLSWQIVHNILPTNQRLHRFSINPSPTCVHCPCEESLEHLFVLCHTAKFVWNEIFKIIDLFNSDTPRIKPDHKLIPYNIIPPPIAKRTAQITLILVNMGKEIIG